MAEVRYDTAGYSVTDGKGILAIQRSFGICGSSLRAKTICSRQCLFWTVQNVTIVVGCVFFFLLSPGENTKMVIVRPASSVVSSLNLHKWL